MAKANILSYVHLRQLEQEINYCLPEWKANKKLRAINWFEATEVFSARCGFTVTESNLRHMLQQLKIDPSEIIDIKQPKQLQKSKPEHGEIVDKLAEAKRLLDEVVAMYAASKGQ